MNAREKIRWTMRRVAKGPSAGGLRIWACVYDSLTKTRSRQVRKLAGSRKAQTARETTEQRLRDIVHAYASIPSLTLRMMTVEDVCTGGGGWSFTPERDYKVACTLYVTAYYSTTGDMGAVLDDILTAGDTAASLIAFNHKNRPHARPESQWLFSPGQNITWDTPPTHEVDEARQCFLENDPPAYRCQREGQQVSVFDVRQQYGKVLQLALNPAEYIRIE